MSNLELCPSYYMEKIVATPSATQEYLFHYISNAVSNTIYDNVISELKEIKKECWQDNWDGENSAKAKEEAISRIKIFASLLPKSIDEPNVFVRRNGDVSLHWKTDKSEALVLTFNETLFITFAIIQKMGRCSGETRFFESIPDNLDGMLLQIAESD